MQQAGAFDTPDPEAPADLLELLLDRFAATAIGQQIIQSPQHRNILVQFLDFSSSFLQNNPVVSHGFFDAGLTLVFQEGETLPLVRSADVARATRPDPVYAVTQPRDARMKGMPIGPDQSVAVTGRGRRR
jgi:hypothetical protein